MDQPRDPRPFAFWVQHFEHNRRRLLPIPWSDTSRLDPDEHRAVGDSIATFQLGETGEGSFLKAAAVRTGDPGYVRAVELFVAEEGRHARELGRFMEREGIPFRRHHWTNGVFRALRKLLGLELCVVVLVTAETIACVYYRALRDATASPVLRALCAQILRDEAAHVAFQEESLVRLRTPSLRSRLPTHPAVRRCLLEVTLLAVWIGHRRCLHAGGHTFGRFRQEVLRTAHAFAHRCPPVAP